MKNKKLKGIIAVAVVSTIILTILPVKAYAEWVQDADNNWNFTENGSFTIGWKQIDGIWYHFDKNGIMETGWVQGEDSKWYYMNKDGSMKTGWLKDTDGNWYNLGISGAMRTGWMQDTDGKYYFISSLGVMQIGIIKVEGKPYLFDESGAILIGKNIVFRNSLYTTDDNGVIIEGKLPPQIKSFRKDGTLIPDIPLNVVDEKPTTTDTTSDNTQSSSSSSHSSSSSSNSGNSTIYSSAPKIAVSVTTGASVGCISINVISSEFTFFYFCKKMSRYKTNYVSFATAPFLQYGVYSISYFIKFLI